MSAQLTQALKEARRLGETNKVDEYRRALTELGRAYFAAHEAAPQQAQDKLDAERWRETLMRVGATRTEWVGGGHMFMVNIKPPSNVMQGSVAQHFTAAIDEAIGKAQP